MAVGKVIKMEDIITVMEFLQDFRLEICASILGLHRKNIISYKGIIFNQGREVKVRKGRRG